MSLLNTLSLGSVIPQRNVAVLLRYVLAYEVLCGSKEAEVGIAKSKDFPGYNRRDLWNPSSPWLMLSFR
jgi:hypothetical protein